jgi:hypothetical protein
MPTGLDPHKYTPLVTEAQAASRVLLRMGSRAVVFYVTAATHELRVRAYESEQVITLLQDVRSAHGFVNDNGFAYIYALMTSGDVQLVIYRYFGDPATEVKPIGIGNKAIYLHAVHQNGWFFLVSHDGGRIYLLMSTDPEFLVAPIRQRLYSNSLDPAYYVDKPVLGIHPDDVKAYPIKSRLTIGIERLHIATGVKEVGFFVTEAAL